MICPGGGIGRHKGFKIPRRQLRAGSSPALGTTSNIMNNWLVASYKINEVKRLERNLLNQRFDYYLPRIMIKKFNSSPIEEALFPGYIFVNTSFEKYSQLKYTIGIKKIIKFGENISCLSDEEIEVMKIAEETSKKEPVTSTVQIGQDATIANGSLKGSIVKICSLSSKERVGVLISFLGSLRRVSIFEKDLIF